MSDRVIANEAASLSPGFTTDDPRFAGPYSEPTELWIHRNLIPIINAKVRTWRLTGADDETVRRHAMAAFFDGNLLGADGTPIDDLRREKYCSWVQRAVADALSEPAPEPVDEASRRLPTWGVGEPIRLCDGAEWHFPRLAVDASEGGLATAKLPWLAKPWGPDFLDRCRMMARIDPEDDAAGSKALQDVAGAFLRVHYRLSEVECKRLIPLDLNDPEVISGFATALPMAEMGPFTSVSEALASAGPAAWLPTAVGSAVIRLIGDVMRYAFVTK